MRHTAPGNKQQDLCVKLKARNVLPSWIWASGTYKNPFPQPRGPKNSSVGRQTFLHTPLKEGQDHGNDAASFSTTVVSNQLHVYTAENIFLWAKRIVLRLTIEQQDNQERQHNQAIASHTWDWLWCQLGSVDLVREEDW